jgi:hypothetical protein
MKTKGSYRRSAYAKDVCRKDIPLLRKSRPDANDLVACHFADNLELSEYERTNVAIS